MTFDERVQALAPLGLTDRQTRFLVTVALHGGYCVRRQYATFAGVGYGKNVRDFLDQLVESRIAVRFSCRTDRGHVYHVNARPVYRAIGQEDNRNRRHVSQALIARKLMLLDFVLELPTASWYATEEDKISLFRERFHVPESALPRRVYEGERIDESSTTRYFVHKLPVYVPRETGVPYFVYLATELGTHAFEQFLRDHLALFRSLPEWVVVCVRPGHLAPMLGCQKVFEQLLSGLARAVDGVSDERLLRFFAIRRAVEHDQLARISAAQLQEFRSLRRKLATPAIEQRYADWVATGSSEIDERTTSAGLSGRLVMHELRHPYEQFGTLAGVA